MNEIWFQEARQLFLKLIATGHDIKNEKMSQETKLEIEERLRYVALIYISTNR